VEVEKLTTK